MISRKIVNSVFAICMLVSAAASADQIILSNGDKLTGTIKAMADSKVLFETELVGTIKIPVSNIETMSTDAPLELHLTDGTVVNEAVTQSGDKKIKLTGKSQEVALSDVAKINPEKPRWKGDISAGATYTSGNTKNESYAFSGNLSKRTEKDRTTFFGDSARKKEKSSASDEKEVTESWWKLGGKYDYFLDEKTYVFGQGRYETDSIADLDRRIIAGVGAGYQWLETSKTDFSTEIGLSSITEEYSDGNSDDSLAAQAGYRLRHNFNDTLSFIHNLNYYPSTEQISDYYLTSSAELRAKINSHLFTNFKILLDYDTTPATGKGKSDTKYIFGAGVNF